MSQRVVVIVPVHNGARQLGLCLEAIRKSRRLPDEVVVADDGSSDGSAAIAEALGARVLRVPGGRRGPAAARNWAARQVTADVLVFIDCDVVLHEDAIDYLIAPLAADAAVAATFGSYDANPPARGIAATYANLRHHYVHQRARRSAGTFWSGCGAIRYGTFNSLGGFNELRYQRPCIEDVELGLRLRNAGHAIRCVPEAQGTHLKTWTVWQLWRTDVLHRAIPWSIAMARCGQVPDDLNTGWSERLSAAAVHSAWAAALLTPVWPPTCLTALGVAASVWLWLNRGLLRLLLRRGMRPLIGGAALHALYHAYSSTVFVAVMIAVRCYPVDKTETLQAFNHPECDAAPF